MESIAINAPAAPQMEETQTERRVPRAAVNGLAVVGFIALLVLGIGLAIYSTRYLPKVASRIGEAGVYFSSLFTPSKGGLNVIPQKGVSFANSGLVATTTASSTVAQATTTPAKTSTPAPTTTHPLTPGPETVITSPGTAPLTGKPDLAVTSIVSGYLTSNSTDSFVASTSVPQGMKPAVKFFVSNIGTNVSVPWFFTADLPALPSFTYTSPQQQALMPGDRIQYVLGFDRATSGTGTATITVDSTNAVNESNESNNTASATITIQGS